jgi:high affinity Mn2+ porin
VECVVPNALSLLTGIVTNRFSAAEPAPVLPPANAQPPTWTWHVQNTDIVQATPGFVAQYSGPNSLDDHGEIRDTVSFDLYADVQLWQGAVAELERRFKVGDRSGAIRFLVYDNRAHMGSYQVALDSPGRPADIVATRVYRYKTGYGVNAEQELAKNVGAFARLGWSDGQNEAWVFADVDRTASLGLSFKCEAWGRPGDTLGLAGVINAISSTHRDFLAAGGTGILAGDGALSYGPEQIVETYYDVRLAPHLNAALDYQFVANPAYNRARGPVSIFAIRLHWSL